MTGAASVPDLDRALRPYAGYALKRAWDAVRADLAATLAPLGLRIGTFSALAVISGRPGLRPADLARALSVERPNLVALVDALEVSGLVERARDPGDRRALCLRATQEGLALLAQAEAAVAAHEARLLRGLGAAERAALVAALDRIAAEAGR